MSNMSERQETAPMNIDQKMLEIFRKEGGDKNNCPKSITLDMLAHATGAELKPRLNDAGIMVKNGNKSGLWYAYYKTTLSAMIFSQDHKDEPRIDFGFGFFEKIKEEEPNISNDDSFPTKTTMKSPKKKNNI